MVIEHLDGNPQNNYYTNLKQSTQSENIKTAITHGTFHQAFNNSTNIIVFDKKDGKTKEYETIKSFFINIGAPEYMIKHCSLSDLNKRKEYKNRFIVERIGRKGRSQQTTESVL